MKVLTLSLMFMILADNSILIPLTLGTMSRDDYTITVLSEKLPLGLFYGSGAWDGKYAYVFGGWDGGHASGVIVKYDPSSGKATALLDNLPSPRSGTAAVYASGTIYGAHNVCYIFGGFSGVGSYDASKEIVRFWPEDGWTDIPKYFGDISGRGDMSAIWDGKSAYLFGGRKAPGESIPKAFLDEILKFEPSKPSASVEILPVKLPHVRAYTSVVWDGKNAYIFGGGFINETYDFEFLDDILKFNPATNEVTTMKAKLPTGRAYTSAIWDGNNAYIFGGQTRLINGSRIALDEVVRYNPSADEASILPQRLPTQREGTVAVWTGPVVYIFGGRDGTGTGSQIVMMSHESQVSMFPFSWFNLVIVSAFAGVAVLLLSIYVIKKYKRQTQEKPQLISRSA